MQMVPISLYYVEYQILHSIRKEIYPMKNTAEQRAKNKDKYIFKNIKVRININKLKEI